MEKRRNSSSKNGKISNNGAYYYRLLHECIILPSLSASSSSIVKSFVLNVILFCLVNKIDNDESLNFPRSTQNYLKEYQSHSLEERDIGHETTLKDSGIDTASSSTILNILSNNDALKKVFCCYNGILLCCLVLCCVDKQKKTNDLYSIIYILADNNVAIK